jgi:tetratricopeptide (TPR) repeat protein
MRLLKLDDNGDLSLIGPLNGDIPEYAILSHTWGVNSEEVTYKDIIKGTGKDKSGYKKIRFCVEQARQDGLRYSWIDTCCINKADLTELSKSINSMFKWYNKATRCYVYLSDVPDPKCHTSELSFSKSKWFTRGWTLQELVAPPCVQFFSMDGKQLGDKRSLERQIHEITGIAVEALQGVPLFQFSIADRLSWAARRETTVEEDTSYCLLGIFNIHMPLIYGEGRQNAMDRLQRKIQKLSNPASVISSGAPWIVPFERNPRFTGRESLLTQLEQNLFAKHHTMRIAVTGLGGVGKTQIVLELLYQIKEKYNDTTIMWVPATSEESLHQGYLDIAQQLGIPGWEDEKIDVKVLVQEFLSKDDASRWLLVFDNADDIDMWITAPGLERENEQQSTLRSATRSAAGSRRLIDCLPKNKRGSIIFTTRDRKAAVKLADKNIIEVREMGLEAGVQLLKKCLASPSIVENRPDTTALLTQLTNLPLAIVQAAAYINENEITLAEYLTLLEDKEEEIVDLLSTEFEDRGRYHDVKNPIATTWLISFEQIRRRDSLAVDYLSFMACVDWRDIPQSLLPPGPSRRKEIDALGTLTAYSFASRRPADVTLDLHRLVHLATRNWLRKEGLLVHWTERAIMRLEEVFPDNNHMKRSIWRTYLPHVRYVLESDVNKDGERKMALLWRYGTCLYSDGRWSDAELSFSRIQAIEMRRLGVDNPNTLTSIAWLASTYRNQGRWEEAEKLEVQVMETRKTKLGDDHPDTLTSIANLASTFWNQGRWEEAEKLFVQVMETRKTKLGDDHPDTLSSIANLASTYRNQGRWEEAEKLFVQVMETRKTKLGDDHPDTLTSIANLASTFWNQGRWEEAEKLEVQVMETRKTKLGDDHPDTLTSMANLASTFWNQGRWEEAEKLEVQVMETSKTKLGADHPSTLNSMANLAFTLKAQARDTEAVQLMDDCVQRQKRILGAHHSNFLSSYAALTEWNKGFVPEGSGLMETSRKFRSSS